MSKIRVQDDFLVHNHGSIALVTPLKDIGRRWIYDNVHEPVWWGGALAVETDHLGDFVAALEMAGFSVKGGGL